jgi:hypothetical protein
MELTPQYKRNVVSRVIGSALHILHESYLPHTKLWPSAGIRIGNGLSVHDRECIFMGANVCREGFGVLHMWPTTKSEQRERSQKKHVKLILDQAIHDGVVFTDQTPGSLDFYLWFDYNIEK